MRWFVFFLGCLGLMAMSRLMQPPEYSAGVQSAIDYFKTQSVYFATSCTSLKKAVVALGTTGGGKGSKTVGANDANRTLAAARLALVECRCRYKTIEAFLEYFFRSSATIYNRAPKFEAEEGGMEYQSPIGLQVIESMLYDAHPDKQRLLEQVDAVESAALDLPALLYGLRADDRQILESLRVELIRIMALDITGYEAPLLKSGIRESRVALEAFGRQLQPYLREGDGRSDSVRYFYERVMRLLDPAGRSAVDDSASLSAVNDPAGLSAVDDSASLSAVDDPAGLSAMDDPATRPVVDDASGRSPGGAAAMARGFDSFDRLGLLRDALLPLQRQLGLLIRERGLELNTTRTLNYSADDLFSADAFAPERFPGGDSEVICDATMDRGATADHEAGGGMDHEVLVALGKQLFNDKRLSGNGQKSCATCHNPAKAFTDQLPVSIGFDGHQRLDRNAPTLLYSAYQFDEFWDGRVKSLEQQIRTVLHDVREMHADTIKETDVIAIAAYVRSLHPFNSPFDRYIRRENDGLTAAAIKGANLFMGKAQCATCHFIPLFNGLIPPDYTLTEFEVLGTTASDPFAETTQRARDTKAPRQPRDAGTSPPGQAPLQLSKDQGRYIQYPLDFFKGAFKTPTVRDAAVTYPYMHNGAFRSLETVMDFYNKGGGAGLGLEVPDQTLPSNALQLTAEERKDIILFIHTLTDSL